MKVSRGRSSTLRLTGHFACRPSAGDRAGFRGLRPAVRGRSAPLSSRVAVRVPYVLDSAGDWWPKPLIGLALPRGLEPLFSP